MNKKDNLIEMINKLESLLKLLQQEKFIEKRIKILSPFLPEVPDEIKKTWQSKEIEFAIKSVYVIEQGKNVFQNFTEKSIHTDSWKNLLQVLLEIEEHYDSIGGIIGYHLLILKFIVEKQNNVKFSEKNERYQQPVGIGIDQPTAEVRQMIRWGILALENMAEIYPVGGAGDRLDLHDEATGDPLPAAELEFCGHSLLEGLIRDLQAREYLHYKLYHKQLSTPIVMMTSHEKNNHYHIQKICASKGWFGRPKELFHFFTQPLVPVVTIEGEWVVQGPLQLMLKPGGHGMIWKLAYDYGILEKLLKEGRKEALIRQINNPISGTDYGLCAFTGWGSHHKKAFGFSSCRRLLDTAEGMDVLVEKRESGHFEYRITNIEYTEFEQKGFQDVPEKPGSPYSTYPANTNILFANLNVIQDVVKTKCAIPGKIINMKTQVKYRNHGDVEKSAYAGRLESMMQNISDFIVDTYEKPLDPIRPNNLSSYITYHERRKTISVAKKSYVAEKPALETPEGCFYELLQNHEELFRQYCKMELPPLGSIEKYLKEGPPFIILFHPCLGPFYQIIGQKIRNGKMAFGSELQLEIAELCMLNVNIAGSVLIRADRMFGSRNANGVNQYNEETGKCVLQNVTIKNKGINRKASNRYWKNQIERDETLKITLYGNAEFHAEDSAFEGNQHIEVQDGYRMEIKNGKSSLTPISQPTWYWQYAFEANDEIALRRVKGDV